MSKIIDLEAKQKSMNRPQKAILSAGLVEARIHHTNGFSRRRVDAPPSEALLPVKQHGFSRYDGHEARIDVLSNPGGLVRGPGQRQCFGLIARTDKHAATAVRGQRRKYGSGVLFHLEIAANREHLRNSVCHTLTQTNVERISLCALTNAAGIRGDVDQFSERRAIGIRQRFRDAIVEYIRSLDKPVNRMRAEGCPPQREFRQRSRTVNTIQDLVSQLPHFRGIAFLRKFPKRSLVGDNASGCEMRDELRGEIAGLQ